MRILYLAGMNSIHSHRWANYFARAGHEVYALSFAKTVQPVLPEIHYIEVISRLPAPFNILSYLCATRRIIKETKPDLTHAHSAGIYGLVALLSGFHPFVLTAWGSDVLLNPRAPVKRFIIKKILKAADLITCDGDNTTEAMAKLGADPQKIKRILFGVDVEKFKPRPNLKNNVPLRVISLRSLEPIYDIETLLLAASIVLKSHPRVEFVIAGDGSERTRLEALAEELGISSAIHFLGKISGEQTPLELAASDIYVSTSLSDSGLASSTAEAMATGLPVVVTDSGDNKKWVDKEFIIPIKSPEKLAEKIIALINDEALRKSQGVRNRKVIEARNNYYVEMEKMEKLYEKIVNSK
jgi:glycosyltransferase involved in cell wall biosynthesis